MPAPLKTELLELVAATLGRVLKAGVGLVITAPCWLATADPVVTGVPWPDGKECCE